MNRTVALVALVGMVVDLGIFQPFSSHFRWKPHNQGLERVKAEKDPSETHQRQAGGCRRLPRGPRCRCPFRSPFRSEAAEYYFERACAPQESVDKKTWINMGNL